MEIDKTLVERTLLLAAFNTLGEVSEDIKVSPGYFSVKIIDLEGLMNKLWVDLELILQKADADAEKMGNTKKGDSITFTTDREGLLDLADLELKDLDEVDWNGDPADFERAHHKLTSVLKRIVEVLRIDAKLKPEEPEEESSTDYEATEWYALTEEEREAKILEIPCRPSAGVVSPFCGAGSDTPCRDRRGKKPGAVGKRKFEFCPSRGDRAYAIFTGLKPIHNAS